MHQQRQPRREERQAPPPRVERPARGEEWSEVPPEIEEMLRAQMAARPSRPSSPETRATGEPLASVAPTEGEGVPSATVTPARGRGRARPAASGRAASP
jgi:hypothetical protein